MKALPATKVLLPYLLGLVLGRYAGCSAHFLQVIFLVALALLAVLFHTRRKRLEAWFLFIGALIFIILGFVQYRLAAAYLPRGHIARFASLKRPATFEGVVCSYPDVRLDKVRVVVAADHLFQDGKGREVTGNMLLQVAKGAGHIVYGDRVRCTGVLRRPRGRRNPGEFDYRAYLAAQDIQATMNIRHKENLLRLSGGHGSWFLRNAVVPAKCYLDGFIRNNLPPEEAALLRGLLIGERGEIPDAVRGNFARLGVVHILAVSGLHVGFIILASMTLFGVVRLPRSAVVLVTILVLVFYAYLTNLKPSVVRASTMGAILLLGTLFERKANIYNSLSLAALLILFFRPLDVFQSGFQLSFFAVLSIVYLYPKLRASCFFNRVYEIFGRFHALRYVIDLFLVSLAAFLGTLPLTAIYFHRLPNLSLVANLVVVPLTFLALGSTIVAVLVNFISHFVASFYVATAWLSLHTVLGVVALGGKVPFAYMEMYRFDPLAAFLYGGLLVLVCEFGNAHARKWLIITCLFLANLWVWHAAIKFNSHLQVTFIDVGQGDSILVRLRDGRAVLIDGGIRDLHFDNGQRVVTPYLKRLGIRKLDAVVLSHADSDHLGGLPYILRHFEVAEVWDNGEAKGSALFREYAHLVDSLKVRHRILRAGDVVSTFAPAFFCVVHPSERFLASTEHSANDGSLVLRLIYGRRSFLFLGDSERQAEERICRLGHWLHSDVLKVGHHGSRTSTSAFLLTRVLPTFAVISVGEGNKFGHPSPAVLRRLSGLGATVLRTDRDRAIIVQTDGNDLSCVNWR